MRATITSTGEGGQVNDKVFSMAGLSPGIIKNTLSLHTLGANKSVLQQPLCFPHLCFLRRPWGLLRRRRRLARGRLLLGQLGLLLPELLHVSLVPLLLSPEVGGGGKRRGGRVDVSLALLLLSPEVGGGGRRRGDRVGVSLALLLLSPEGGGKEGRGAERGSAQCFRDGNANMQQSPWENKPTDTLSLVPPCALLSSLACLSCAPEVSLDDHPEHGEVELDQLLGQVTAALRGLQTRRKRGAGKGETAGRSR